MRGCERVGPGSADEVPEYLTRALERFKEEHHDGERFHEWEPRRPNEELWGVLRGFIPAASDSG